MTTVSAQSASINLAELVKLASKDFVVLRHKGKISFALVRLEEGDLEALSLRIPISWQYWTRRGHDMTPKAVCRWKR
jgi:hypothetical protein